MDKTLFDVHWKHACELCPSFEKAGIKSDVYGPEAFTPDHKPIMGEDPKCVGKRDYLFLKCTNKAFYIYRIKRDLYKKTLDTLSTMTLCKREMKMGKYGK